MIGRRENRKEEYVELNKGEFMLRVQFSFKIGWNAVFFGEVRELYGKEVGDPLGVKKGFLTLQGILGRDF